MAFEGFLRVGGNEIVNNERVRGYARTIDCPVQWIKGEACEGLQPALGDAPYVAANISDAPWFDPALPELTGRFLGVFGTSVDLIHDSTRMAAITEGISDGGVIGRSRKGVRQSRYRATLIAKGMDALDYGISWLNAALDPGACGQHGSQCGTTDVEFFTACPPAPQPIREYSAWAEARRNLIPNPQMTTSTTGWFTVSATLAATSDGMRVDLTSAASPAAVLTQNPGIATVAGRMHYASMEVRVPLGQPAVTAHLTLGVGATTVGTGQQFTIQPGETQTLAVASEIGVPSGGTTVNSILWLTSAAVGQRIYVRNGLLTIDTAPTVYFDGDTRGGELVRYSWAGAEDASQSIRETRTSSTRQPTALEYAGVINEYRRFLHDTAVISGPLRVQLLKSTSERDVYGAVMEWTIASERPWIYSITKPVDLPVTENSVIQDIPYNLAPYPSAELSTGTVVVATNYAANPSLETNATGWGANASEPGGTWSASNLTSARVTGELAAVGTASFRTVFTAPSAGTAASNTAIFYNQYEADVTARPAGSSVSVNLWSASVVMSGTPTREAIRIYAFWRATSGGSVIGSAVFLGTVPADGGALSISNLVPPAGANFVLIRAQLPMTAWGSGNVVRLYSDALTVSVP